MKHSKEFNGVLNPEHKKTTSRTTMDPITDIDSLALTIWNRLRKEVSFRPRSHYILNPDQFDPHQIAFTFGLIWCGSRWSTSKCVHTIGKIDPDQVSSVNAALVSGPIHRCANKEESNVINHNCVSNYVYCLPNSHSPIRVFVVPTNKIWIIWLKR